MPRYQFFCTTCGYVDLWRSFADASLPAFCPQCQVVVKRVYTLPGLARNPAPLTHALDRANKSAYEPSVVRRQYTSTEAKPSIAPHGRPWQIGH